jgi:hypothetical protein
MWEIARALFLRWCHCMWWFLRPWRWTRETHCNVDIRESTKRFKNPKNAARLHGCTCGRVFYSNGPESEYRFNEFLKRLRIRQGKKRWK